MAEVEAAGFGAEFDEEGEGEEDGGHDEEGGEAHGRGEGGDAKGLGEDSAALGAGGDPAGAASADMEGIGLGGVGEEDGEDAIAADDEEGNGEDGAEGGVAIEEEDADEAEEGDDDEADEGPLGAPAAVEEGAEEDGGEGDEGGLGEELRREGNAVALGREVGGEPEEESEIDEAPGEGGEAKGGGFADEAGGPEGGLGVVGVGVRRVGVIEDVGLVFLILGEGVGDGAKASHDLVGLVVAAAGEEEFGGFRNEGAEGDEEEAGGEIHEPEDAPAQDGDEEVGKGAGGEVATDCAETADEDQGPAAMARGHGLGEERIGDGEHATGGGAHEEAHADIPRERGHGAADGGADKHDGGEEDGGLAAVEIGEGAPDDGTDDGANEGEEGNERGGGLGHGVFLRHAGHDEAKRGGFHDVDDEGDDEDDHEAPMGGAEGGILGGADGNALGDARGKLAGEQTIGGHADAGDNEEHAKEHAGIHGHADEDEAVVLPHPKHGDVQEHPGGDSHAAEDKGPNATAVEEDIAVHAGVAEQEGGEIDSIIYGRVLQVVRLGLGRQRAMKTEAQQRWEQFSTRVVFFIAGFGMAAWAPLVPYAKGRAGIDDGTLGLLLLGLGAGSLVAMPLTGALAGRRGCRFAIILSSVLAMVALPVLATGSSFAVLAGALLLFGAGIGSLDVAMNIQAVVVERESGRTMMSGFHGLFSVGGIVSAGGLSVLLKAGLAPLSAVGCVVGGMAVALAIATPYLLRERAQSGGPAFVVPHGVVLFLGVLCFILFLTEGAVLDWSAWSLVKLQGLDVAQGGLGYAAFATTMTVGRLTGDWFVRKFGPRRIVVFGGLGAAAGLLLATFAPAWQVALLGYALVGAGCSNIVPVFFSAVGRQKVMPESAAIPAMTTLGYAGILAGPAGIGFVAQVASLPVAFVIVAAMLVGVAASARWLGEGGVRNAEC